MNMNRPTYWACLCRMQMATTRRFPSRCIAATLLSSCLGAMMRVAESRHSLAAPTTVRALTSSALRMVQRRARISCRLISTPRCSRRRWLRMRRLLVRRHERARPRVRCRQALFKPILATRSCAALDSRPTTTTPIPNLTNLVCLPRPGTLACRSHSATCTSPKGNRISHRCRRTTRNSSLTRSLMVAHRIT